MFANVAIKLQKNSVEMAKVMAILIDQCGILVRKWPIADY